MVLKKTENMLISLIMPVCQVGARFMSSQSSENSFGEELTVHPLFSQMINNSHGVSPVALWFHSLAVLCSSVLRGGSLQPDCTCLAACFLPPPSGTRSDAGSTTTALGLRTVFLRKTFYLASSLSSSFQFIRERRVILFTK